MTTPLTWQFADDCAVVVHIEGTALRLDRDPPDLTERQAALAQTLLRLAAAGIERQQHPLLVVNG